MSVVTVSAKGHIVLPQELRENLGIRNGDQVELSREGDQLVVRPLPQRSASPAWRSWRGSLSDTTALADHICEHRLEVESERLP